MVDLGDFEPGSDESASGQADSNRSTAGDAAPSTSEETDAEATSADRTPSSAAESDDSTGDVAFERYDAAPAGQDRGIGAIAVSQGLRVAEDGDDTSLRAYVTTGNRDTVRLGKYLLVPYPDDELLFSRITALEYA